MKTIKTNWNSGNFSLSHEVECSDDQVLLLAEKGLLWYMQRNRQHDVVLGAFETVNGKQVRRKAFKRGDVGYGKPLADKLTAAYGEVSLSDAEVDKLPVDTAVGEYIRDVTDSKFTEETAIASRHESAGDLEDWLKAKCKFEGDTHGDDGEYSAEMLRAVRGYKLEVLRASAAGI